MLTKRRAFGMCAVLAPMVVHQASAATIEMSAITNNSGSASSFEEQLSVEFNETAPDSGVVEFVVSNNSGEGDSVIDAIYIDDNGTAGTKQEVGSSNFFKSLDGLPADWDAPTQPGNLAAGSDFTFFATFSAGTDNAWNIGGIGSTKTFTLSLIEGKSFDDLVGAFETGEVRVGLHLLLSTEFPDAFGDTTSESYLSSVPEPSSLALLALGAACMLRRRR